MGSRVTYKDNWGKLSREVKQGLDDVTEYFAGLIEGSAAAAAPVQYGILRDSIQAQDARAGARLARRRITVGANYGLFQHEGTKRGINPNPFLADAVAFWSAQYIQAIGLVVKNGG